MNEATKIGFYNGGVLENGNYEVKNICILPEYQGKGIGTKLLKENNLPDIRFHDLRATYSTLLLKNNFNSKAISKLMGHATDIITMDVYGDNDEIIADCVDELDSFIESVRPENNESEIQIGDESDISIDENILNELTVF